MNERTRLDDLRDLLDGRLAPAEVEGLRAQIATDAALRADYESFRQVRDLTAAEAPAAPLRVTAADVLARDGGRVLRPRRWWIAAAVVAAAAVGAGVSHLGSRAAEPRVVALVALRVPSAPGSVEAGDAGTTAPPPEVPARLADYAPVRGGKPQWIATWDEGRAIAAAASKPMLAYVFHPECPACIRLDAATFTDAEVLADLDGFVPVKVDVMTLREEDPLAKRLAAGWPYVAAIRADDRTIHEIAGRWEPGDVKPELRRAAAEARKDDPGQPTWEQVREAANAERRGEELARSGRSGEALRDFGRAARLAPASGIAARALWSEAGLRARAQKVLAEAAAGRADAAALDAAAAEFAGDPVGTDLAGVATALRATGAFPVLRQQESKR